MNYIFVMTFGYPALHWFFHIFWGHRRFFIHLAAVSAQKKGPPSAGDPLAMGATASLEILEKAKCCPGETLKTATWKLGDQLGSHRWKANILHVSYWIHCIILHHSTTIQLNSIQLWFIIHTTILVTGYNQSHTTLVESLPWVRRCCNCPRRLHLIDPGAGASRSNGSCFSHGCSGSTPDSVQDGILRASTVDLVLHRHLRPWADSGHSSVVADVPTFPKYETTWWTGRRFMGSGCHLLAAFQLLFAAGTKLFVTCRLLGKWVFRNAFFFSRGTTSKGCKSRCKV